LYQKSISIHWSQSCNNREEGKIMAKPVVISVEDDMGLYDLIALTLRALPIDLHHATNGTQAVQLITELDPDLIILDIHLPDFHGWEVLERTESVVQNVKGVIVLTTHRDPMHRVIGRLKDVTAYMFKPFRPKELQDLVVKTLNL
jgi:DNA-binding response OmpR family regulator